MRRDRQARLRAGFRGNASLCGAWWGSITRVIERADQLVLEFVSRVADAAHGRLRPEQRLAFLPRVRGPIEPEPAGRENPKQVARVIARFGTPAQLIEREL